MVINVFLISDGRDLKPPAPEVTLRDVIKETVRIKRTTGRRERYVRGLEYYLNLFARGRESLPVQEIGVEEIRAWFNSRNEKPVTCASNLGRLSAMFGLCVKRDYISSNPCLKIDKSFIDRTPPAILTLRQCAKALVWTMRNQPDFLAWLTLAMLAGARPEEVDRLSWGCIDLRRGELRIDAAASKVRTRRIVHLSLACVAWLNLARAMGSPLPMPNRSRERRKKLMRPLRLDTWPQDILRHTAASYLLARFQDVGKVAMMLGNSASILNQHYKELVQVENGVRFCNLLPSPAMVKRVNAQSLLPRLPQAR
jgi:integrase/recombinase XerD